MTNEQYEHIIALLDRIASALEAQNKPTDVKTAVNFRGGISPIFRRYTDPPGYDMARRVNERKLDDDENSHDLPTG